VSKDRSRSRAAREREAAIKQAAKGHEQDRQDRQVSMKGGSDVLGKHGGASITPPQHHKPRKPGAKPTAKSAKPGAKPGGKGRPTPKRGAAAQQSKKRRTPVGRPDGPLARRRRFRIRLLIGLLLLVNVAVGVVWREWPMSLAVLIVSVVVAPLLAALLLRRR